MKNTSGTLVSWHKSNFEDYITKYASANSLSMSGDEWERALAAAGSRSGLVAEGRYRVLTHQQVMNELAKEPASAGSAASPHLHDAMLAIAAEAGEDWLDVHDRIIANQRLWQFEDENVPRALLIRYSWVENGVLRGPHEETVSIILPSSLAARFKT